MTRAARGGAVTFVGAASSAALGFAFSVLAARLLGAGDAGVVLQAIAVLSIGLSLGRLGADTTAVWLLPRLRDEEPQAVAQAVRALLLLAAGGALGTVLIWFAAVRPWWPRGGGGEDVVAALDVAVWALPAGVLLMVVLACTRAFGRIVAFNLVDNVTVPALRVVGIVAIHLAALGATAGVLAWAAPWVPALAVAALVLWRATRGARRASAPTDRVALRRRIGSYALPRAYAQTLEQSIIWLDVVLVGMLLGAAAAGVYGSAARFVAAGMIVATALRIVVAPRFSALLGQGRTGEVEQLYRVTARWILFFGAPVYLTLAVYAPTVLGWLGPEFAEGRWVLVILAGGSLVVLAAGNVQALLLMSGRSAAGAANKTVVLVVNVVGNLVLVPSGGIEAAAAVWAASMVLDTVLASIQVRRATGVHLDWWGALRVAGGLALAVALPMTAVAWFAGQGTVSLVVAVAAGAVGLALLAVIERRHLNLTALRPVLGNRG